MIQDRYTPSQLQSLIEKYQRELLESYKRQTLKGAEIKAAPKPQTAGERNGSASPAAAKKPEQARAKTGLPADARIENNTSSNAANRLPEISRYGDDCPVAPSMLMPKTAAVKVFADQTAAQSVSLGQGKHGFKAEDEFPASPSMFRPVSAERRMEIEFDDCPPSPSMFRPFKHDKRAVFASMPEPDTSKPASLQVKVTTGRHPIPVSGARVAVSRNGVSTQKIQKVTHTDRNGCTPIISIPNSKPLSPYTIEVTANGFCGARYSGIPLYSGVTSVQHVDLIPIPTGEKDIMILFDQPVK